ncbi:hypothetical protein ACIHAA_01345 [Streptomyces sp. NPDC052040]|uniref:hypothetical protein n=1 Tax=Streptomyces sp. NPDC052040 TaxID=3365682 RepID=UPI0037CF4786
MVHGITVRWLLTALSAVLLALQLVAPHSSSAASAHRTQAAAAGFTAPVTGKRADDTEETAVRGGTGSLASPTGPQRVRDRHRTAAAPAPGSLAPTPSAPGTPAARSAAPHPSRPSSAHTPGALQVFRC